MERLLGYKVGSSLAEAFAKADRLNNRLGAEDIEARFELAEDGMILYVLVAEEDIEQAEKIMQKT